MKRYVTQQLVQLVIVIVGISLLSFAIFRHRRPRLLLFPQNAGKEEFERYRKLLGLDQPLWVQYWKFASRAVLGDFGKSWYADTPAFTLVLERMPATIYLTFAGLGVALVIALPLGILAALKRHSLVDNACTILAVGGQAMPLFWLGIMLIILAVRLVHFRIRDLAALRHALVLPRGLPGPRHHAPGALRGDRGDEHGVHQDGARQGGGRAHGGGQARLSQRVHSRDHRARPPVRAAPRGGDRHRDRFAWPRWPR
jgi:peptide/nickel transport system permease protein